MLPSLPLPEETRAIITRLSKVRVQGNKLADKIKTNPPEILQVWQLLVAGMNKAYSLERLEARYSCTRAEIVQLMDSFKGFLHPDQIMKFAKSFKYGRKDAQNDSQFDHMPT